MLKEHRIGLCELLKRGGRRLGGRKDVRQFLATLGQFESVMRPGVGLGEMPGKHLLREKGAIRIGIEVECPGPPDGRAESSGIGEVLLVMHACNLQRMLSVEHHQRARKRKEKQAKRKYLAVLVMRSVHWILRAGQPAPTVTIGAVGWANAAVRPATARGMRCAHLHGPRAVAICRHRISAIAATVVLKAATLTGQGLGLRRCGLRLADGRGSVLARKLQRDPCGLIPKRLSEKTVDPNRSHRNQRDDDEVLRHSLSALP